MSIDEKLRQTFERHGKDVHPRRGAWPEIERRVRASHRRRILVVGAGVALSVTAIALALPRVLNERPIDPTIRSGWRQIESRGAGVRLSYPRDWIATDESQYIALTPPGPPRGPEGLLAFQMTVGRLRGRYDAHPNIASYGERKTGEIDGRRFVRNEWTGVTDPVPPPQNVFHVQYLIDWVGPEPSQPYALHIAIAARFPDLWERYLPTAERIVRTVEPSSSETPTQPAVLSKINERVSLLATGKDAIWGLYKNSSSSRSGVLLRIDPHTNEVTNRIGAGENPMAVAADPSAIWVTNNDGCTSGCLQYETTPIARNSLTRFDPSSRRMVSTMKVPQRPQDVTLAFGSVWVTAAGPLGDKGTRLLRIDPTTNAIIAGMRLGETDIFAAIDHDDRYIWVLNPQQGGHSFQVVRVDPRNNGVTRFREIPGSTGVSSLTTGAGSVWITSIGKESASGLARLDATTGRTLASITLPDASPFGLTAVTSGEGFIWATSYRGSLWKVDPSTNAPVGDPVLIGDSPPNGANHVATGFGSVWIVVDDAQIWRMSP
jgi:streptogramin lyase